VRASHRLDLGQLVSFVAVAFVLNAQFTFWVYHALRDNRERLDLERIVLLARAGTAARDIDARIRGLEAELLALPVGVIPAVHAPISRIVILDAGPDGERPGWTILEGKAAFSRPIGRGRRAVAVLDPQTPYAWLATAEGDLQLVDTGVADPTRPVVALAPPFYGLVVAPDFQAWEKLLDAYQRRVFLIIAEGGFFLAAMITAVVLLWRVVRRESLIEHQHQSFVSAVTHELKTPIAGIRLALETVLSGRVDEAGRHRFLGNALADAERLSGLVEKILEVTRYAGAGRRLRIEISDLSSLIEEEVGVAERRATARGAVIAASITPAIQAPIDAEALAIVISNLIENALKYAHGEPPRVDVRLTIERGEAIIVVRDNGIGIRAQDLEEIFKPFVRASDAVTRRTPGTGIGLYVAREIVAGHGGKLTAASEGPGKGATFRLVLPGAEVVPDDEFSE